MSKRSYRWKRKRKGRRTWKWVAVGLAMLVCLLGVFLAPIPKSDAGPPVTGVVWVTDQEANSIFHVLPLTNRGPSQEPLIVYDSGAEEEIIDFMSRLDPAPSEVRIVESVPKAVPAAFAGSVESETGIAITRKGPSERYTVDAWIKTAGGPRAVAVAEEEAFMPYAAVYAHRTGGAFASTRVEVVELVQNDTDVVSIEYFGNDPATAADFSALAATYGKTYREFGSLRQAMIALTPSHLDATENIVTVVHAGDNGSTASNRQFWKLAPVYAAMRNTMLITVEGSTAPAVDSDIDLKLDGVVLPNNGNVEPDYLVMVGHWLVLPYRFGDDRLPYLVSADAMYADRDEDGYYVPEIPFGRITGYGMGQAGLLINRGLFLDAGKMTRATRAVLASDWPIEREEVTITALEAMYGPDKVYARGDIELSNSLVNNPPRSEVLAEARGAEITILTGHGNPNYLAATNPAVTGRSIRSGRFYPPSFWWFSGCDTGSYYSLGTSLVSAALTSGAANVWAAVDTAATHSSALEWYPGFLAEGNDIGSALQKGLKRCEAHYGAGSNVNKLPQIYHIGDPLVNYGSFDLPNQPPKQPGVPVGAESGLIGQELAFEVGTIDPEGGSLTYIFAWGDGETSVVAAVPSGEPASAAHAWTETGTYSVEVRASDSEGLASNWSPPLTVTITAPQHPWEQNQNGLVFTDRAWDYTLGYTFIPQVGGTITQLGGRFDGVKTVYLWDVQGNLLASAEVNSANDWSYVMLQEPVEVRAGLPYKVAVYAAGSGATYARYIAELPQTYGSITVLSSCYESGNAFPRHEAANFMFGQVDIEFIPGG